MLENDCFQKLSKHLKAAYNEYHREEVGSENKVLRKERYVGEFVRRFYVENVDEDRIKAKLQDGVLKLEIPKKADHGSEGKRIRIE